MAKSSMQWIPSGGVLAVAVAAGLLAAILVNVYLGYVKGQYEYDSQPFFVLKEDLPLGTALQQRNLDRQRIPKPLLPAFEKAKAVQDDAKGNTLIGQKARRALQSGTFLWWPDFIETEAAKEIPIPKGSEMITIRVDPSASLGQQLRPGDWVNVRGLFDIGSDPRQPQIEPYDVMKNVQVRLVNGSLTPPPGRTDITNIQVIVPSAVAKQLLQIQQLGKGPFAIGEVATPDVTMGAEPKIEPEVLALLKRPRMRTPGAPGAVLAPPPEPAPTGGPVPLMP
ncbi:MAG: hypothetical protein FJ288_08540 [Planctomycetes bacterium]|nr:hypothetical protein [Planctomycetota bacterium]